MSVDAFGRPVGESVVVIIGRRYGVRGMYVEVCLERWISERMMQRWKG